MGASDRTNSEPDGEAFRSKDLLATVAHNVIDVGPLRQVPAVPGDLSAMLQAGRPVA